MDFFYLYIFLPIDETESQKAFACVLARFLTQTLANVILDCFPFVLRGCINHALMTAGSIRAAGLNLVGWVANRIDPNMPAIEENIATLKAMLKAPCIADVAWGEEPQFIDF